jgi:inner membrane protein
MLAPTHAALGILFTAAALQTVNPVVLSVAGIASLIPDIDHPKSVLGRVFFPISRFISDRFSHRTITHSWIGVFVCILVAAILWMRFPQCAAGLVCGYVSGVVGDMFTKSGVNFFFPAKVSVIVFRNPALRFKTGSLSELGVLLLIFAGTIGVFNLHSQGGLVRIYEQFVGNPKSAIAYFNQNFNSYIITAEVVGFKSSDRQPINNRYRIIQVDASVFVLQDERGYIYRASTSGDVEVLIEKIKAEKSVPVSTKADVLVLDDEPILERIKSLGNADEVYLFGALDAVDDVDGLRFPVSDDYLWPVWTEGEKLIFYAARPKQLESLGDRYGTGRLTVMRVSY